MEETITTSTPQVPTNPFAAKQYDDISAGTVEIESRRAIAEAQGALVIAKRFPRDPHQAFAEIMEACSHAGLANEAMYSYPRAGQTVTGPSIRLAEVMATCWRNLEHGVRELSRSKEASEMEAFCWDTERNVKASQRFTVRHLVDLRSGARPTKDEREIYELTANMGARRKRAMILAILPPDLVDAAIAQCDLTLQGKADVPMGDRLDNMAKRFTKYGVTLELIEMRLGHKLAQTLPTELAEMQKIYNSLKDNMSSASDWFAVKRTPLAGESTPEPTTKPDGVL